MLTQHGKHARYVRGGDLSLHLISCEDRVHKLLLATILLCHQSPDEGTRFVQTHHAVKMAAALSHGNGNVRPSHLLNGKITLNSHIDTSILFHSAVRDKRRLVRNVTVKHVKRNRFEHRVQQLQAQNHRIAIPPQIELMHKTGQHLVLRSSTDPVDLSTLQKADGSQGCGAVFSPIFLAVPGCAEGGKASVLLQAKQRLIPIEDAGVRNIFEPEGCMRGLPDTAFGGKGVRVAVYLQNGGMHQKDAISRQLLADMPVDANTLAVPFGEGSVSFFERDLLIADRDRKGKILTLGKVIPALLLDEGIFVFDADAHTRKLNDQHISPPSFLFFYFITRKDVLQGVAQNPQKNYCALLLRPSAVWVSVSAFFFRRKKMESSARASNGMSG